MIINILINNMHYASISGDLKKMPKFAFVANKNDIYGGLKVS